MAPDAGGKQFENAAWLRVSGLAGLEMCGCSTRSLCFLAELGKRDMIHDARDIKYSSGRPIGSGSMGVLYAASLRGRQVAVKHQVAQDARKPGQVGCLVGAASCSQRRRSDIESALDEMIMSSKVRRLCRRVRAWMLWLRGLLIDCSLGVAVSPCACQVRPHPNIVEFVGVSWHPVLGPRIVYELIDGMSLEEYCEAQRDREASRAASCLASAAPGRKRGAWRPDLDHALCLGAQLFAALEWLHEGQQVFS